MMDAGPLSQRVAIITGGAGFLGSEFSATLARAGAAVMVADIDIARAEAVAEQLRSEGAACLAVGVDVTEKQSIARMVERTLADLRRIDILVNSAALDPKFDPAHREDSTQAFEDYSLEAWTREIEVNLTGAFLCSQAVARPMLRQGGGVIVNVCSIYGMVGPDQRIYQRPGHPAQYKPPSYSVSKAGILGLTRYLATYFAGKDIRVNTLTPGGVFADHDPGFVESYSARTVLGRMARRDEMNAALLFLASDASSYMTGANLVVDGGWTAW